MNMRNIYRKIAKEHGVTVSEVKRDMQEAINYAYKNPNKSDVEKLNQNQISCSGEIPTIEEFIKYAVMRLKE